MCEVAGIIPGPIHKHLTGDQQASLIEGAILLWNSGASDGHDGAVKQCYTLMAQSGLTHAPLKNKAHHQAIDSLCRLY